jgi:uridine kinase
MHYIYVEPTKYLADIVLNSGLNDVVFDVIKVKIQSHLSHQSH